MSNFDSKYIVNIRNSINKIDGRYDGEWDLPNASNPPVTWVEKELADCVRMLTLRVEELEDANDALRKRLEELEYYVT